jgi:hypothetical protein
MLENLVAGGTFEDLLAECGDCGPVWNPPRNLSRLRASFWR